MNAAALQLADAAHAAKRATRRSCSRSPELAPGCARSWRSAQRTPTWTRAWQPCSIGANAGFTPTLVLRDLGADLRAEARIGRPPRRGGYGGVTASLSTLKMPDRGTSLPFSSTKYAPLKPPTGHGCPLESSTFETLPPQEPAVSVLVRVGCVPRNSVRSNVLTATRTMKCDGSAASSATM